jgi:hypothetical protein
MGLIKQHLQTEENKQNPDKYVVEQLKKILENGTLSFDEWKLSGRFVPRESFERNRPEVKLHEDCAEVVSYFCAQIQALKTNQFYTHDGIYCSSIVPLEKFIWSEIEKKLF